MWRQLACARVPRRPSARYPRSGHQLYQFKEEVFDHNFKQYQFKERKEQIEHNFKVQLQGVQPARRSLRPGRLR